MKTFETFTDFHMKTNNMPISKTEGYFENTSTVF